MMSFALQSRYTQIFSNSLLEIGYPLPIWAIVAELNPTRSTKSCFCNPLSSNNLHKPMYDTTIYTYLSYVSDKILSPAFDCTKSLARRPAPVFVSATFLVEI